jgi:hypothetical protein
MGELERVGDQLACGVLGHPEGSGQVDGSELRHPRSTGTGEWDQAFVVQISLTPVRRGFVGRAGMQVRPGERHLQLFDCRSLSSASGGADTVDHLGRGEGRRCVHGETLGAGTDSFDGVFENMDNFLEHPGRDAAVCRRTTVWSRLSARFARCSTTGGCGERASYG